MPSTSAGSVITAPAEMKNSGVVKSTTAAFLPSPGTARRVPRSKVSHTTARQATSDEKRAANSLTPNTRYVAAVSHVDSGGLLQCGTPYLNCGHNQSPVSIILRAISP